LEMGSHIRTPRTILAVTKKSPLRATFFDRRRLALGEHRDDEKRGDVENLDHRVDGRASGVLVRVADGVAGDGGLVGEGLLAAVDAGLDVLLGVVPGSTAGRHGDGDEDTGDDGADEHTTEGFKAKLFAEEERDDDRSG